MSPRKARLIGYIILFASFPFFGLAGGMTSVGGGILSMLFLTIGGLMAAASVIWMVRKVRCPHCNTLLHLKLYPIDRCPHCGKSTDPDSMNR